MSSFSSDVQRRRPVWIALSDLFLDTELQEADLRRIASAVVTSGYTDAEVEAILYGEVYPACIWNMRQVAGEWAGFDPDWLERVIRRTRWMVWLRWRAFQPDRWMIRDDWRKVTAFVGELRAGTGCG